MRFTKPRRHIRKAGPLAAVLVTLAALSAGISAAPPASAATGCHATGCAGHDPTTHGCTATSWTTTSGALATIWNRYSAGCDANWARGQLTAAALNAGDKMYLEIGTKDSAGHYEDICWPGASNDQGGGFEACSGSLYGGSAIAYSDMVDGTDMTYATVTVFNSSGGVLAQYEADQ
jgi:hypothetical protein